MLSGIRVFFIQKHCTAASGKTNSMPRCIGMEGRFIRPVARSALLLATSASMRCMPAESSMVGAASAAALGSSSNKTRSKDFMRARAYQLGAAPGI
jgi:hypothetical protein